MRNFSKLRVVLAVLTMLGAFHLRAEAAPRAAANPSCYQEVYDYGWNTCESSTGGNWEWGIVYYWEFADGSCWVTDVQCF